MTPKVAFTVYQSAFQSPGGGEIQLLKTKEYLEKSGIPIHCFDTWKDKLKDFQILHTFGSVKDSLGLMEAAHALGVKNVLSTICWYSWKSAWGTHASFSGRLAAVGRHAAKSFFPFVPSMRKRMMQISDILLPNSQSEAQQLKSFFGVREEKIFVVPNGVDPSFALARPEPFIEKYKLKDFILCVGRIEPRKNQLQVIRSLNNASVPVVFIGAPVPHHQNYYDTCRREAGKDMHFLGPIPHDSGLIASAYAACNTFLLPTWLETPGLAALEAGLAGAKVVITQEGATREYFGDYATYVNPSDWKDIRRKTLLTYQGRGTSDLKNHIQSHYLWEHTAQKTKEAYQKVLQSS